MTAAAPIAPARPPGVSVIITYKVVKAFLQAVAAVVLATPLGVAIAARLHALGDRLEAHAVHGPLSALAHLLLGVGTMSRLHVIALVLGLDALVSGLEGYLLWKGSAAGRWLVVLTTGALVPWEAVEVARHPGPARALLLGANAAVVAYLVWLERRTARRRPAGVDPATP